MKNTTIIVAWSAITLLRGVTLGAESIWNGADGDFNVPTNWSPVGVPGFSTAVRISSGTARAVGSDTFFERGAETWIDGGRLVLNNLRFLNGRGGSANFRIQSGSLDHDGTYFIVGQNDRGSFVLEDGSVNSLVSRGFFLSDGGGATSQLEILGGLFAVEMNGVYNSDLHNVWVGRGAGEGGAHDRIVVDGGDFSVVNTASGVTGRWFMMSRNSSFLLNSGSVSIENFQAVTIGQARSGVPTANTATMVVRDGSMRSEVRVAFVVGWGTNGALGISGGTLTIAKVGSTGGDLWIDGSNTTNWAGVEQSGGIVTVEGEVLLARDSSGTVARYTLSGGELRAANLRRGSGAHGQFLFKSGMLTLEGDRRGLENEPWFVTNGAVTVEYDAVANLTRFTINSTPVRVAALSYSFDTDFMDQGPSSNHGSGQGGVGISDDSVGVVVGSGSARFDGSVGSRVGLSRAVSFGITDPWTVSWWARRSELGGSKGMVLGERGSLGNFVWLRDSGVGGVRFRPESVADIDFVTPRDSAMRHYALVADGTGQLSLYLDGELRETRSGLTAWTLDSIGEAYPTTSSNFNFEGWIDELRVFATDLDATAVADLYLSQAPADPVVEPGKVYVFLLGGQSNAVGHGIANELPGELFYPQDRADLFNFFPDGTDFWGTVRPGLSRSGSFGPEISMGRWLADHYAEREPEVRVVLIKYARGGTNLYSQWRGGGGGTRSGDGPEYQIFQDTVVRGLERISMVYPDAEVSIKGMAWMQGEADCTDAEAPNYEVNLRTFIEDIRATYGAGLPFVVGRLSINQTNRQPVPLATVMQAQTVVSNGDPRVGLVDTNGFGLLADNLHFDSSGNLEMGEAFGRHLAYLAWMMDTIPEAMIDQGWGELNADPNANGFRNELEWLFRFSPVAYHAGLAASIRSVPGGVEFEINRVVPEGVFFLREAPSPGGPWSISADQPRIEGFADRFTFEIPMPVDLPRFFQILYEP